MFDGNIFKSDITPKDYNLLESEAKLILNHDNFNFTTGFQSFENLSLSALIDINTFYRIMILINKFSKITKKVLSISALMVVMI